MRLCRGWHGTGLLQADRVLAAHRRAMVTGARIQLDRHADGLGHRARSLRTVVRGQVDIHAQRLAVAALAGARAARRVDQDETVALGRRAGRLAGLPARLLEVEELRAGQRRRLLGAYDYQRQLERGYSVTRAASGAVLRSVDGLAPGSALATQLADGSVGSTVTEHHVERTRRTQRREATDGHTQGK